MTDRSRPSDPTEHLGADTLADLREGLLDARAAEIAAAHLSHCATCTADDLALGAIPGLLSAAADVGTVPDDVARRLDEALAAEAPVQVAAAATVTALSSRTAGPAPVRGMRLLQAAAVLVVVLLGVGIAVGTRGGDNDDTATNASAGAAGDSQAETRADGSFPVTSSGREWTKESVAARLPDLLSGSLGAAAPEVASSEASPSDEAGGVAGGDSGSTSRELSGNAAARLAGGPTLAECVTALNDGPVTPLAVDLGTWEDKPAAVIVLPTPGDQATVDEWVVAPNCSLADAKVLYFVRVARP